MGRRATAKEGIGRGADLLQDHRSAGRVGGCRHRRRGCCRRAVRHWRRRLHLQGALHQRRAARQGRPGRDRRHRRRVGRGHHADRRRPGRSHDHARRTSTAAPPRAPRRSSARPRCPASPTATSTCSPPAGYQRRRSRRRAIIGTDHTTTAVDLDQVFNVFGPRTAQGARPAHPRVLQHVRRQQRSRQRRVAVPQPVPGLVGAPVRRPSTATAAAAPLHRRQRPSWSPTSPRASTTSPASSTTSPTRPRAIGSQRAALAATRSPRCPRSCARPTRRS